jgi:hypothetical protein
MSRPRLRSFPASSRDATDAIVASLLLQAFPARMRVGSLARTPSLWLGTAPGTVRSPPRSSPTVDDTWPQAGTGARFAVPSTGPSRRIGPPLAAQGPSAAPRARLGELPLSHALRRRSRSDPPSSVGKTVWPEEEKPREMSSPARTSIAGQPRLRPIRRVVRLAQISHSSNGWLSLATVV